MAEAKRLFVTKAAEALEVRLIKGNITREQYQDKLEELANFMLEDQEVHMKKVKEILAFIALIVCLIVSTYATINNFADTSDLPVANYGSETGFHYTYE